MPRCIAKLADDKWVEWSTVVDAPVTYTMTREEMKQHLLHMYGHAEDPEPCLVRAETNGTSFHTKMSIADLVSGNRAGPKESTLSLEEIIRDYDGKNPATYTQSEEVQNSDDEA